MTPEEVQIADEIIHSLSCHINYPEKLLGENQYQRLEVCGMTILQCVDCGAYKIIKEQPLDEKDVK